MPTGYTYCVEEGATFEQFVWRCARGMGALITLRDDSMDAPTPERLKPQTEYHEKRIAECRARLRFLDSLSAEGAEQAGRQEREDYVKAMAASSERTKEKQALYRAMRAKVADWKPPTKDHEGLKEFMLDQLDMSIDTSEWKPDLPPVLSGPAWRDREMANAQKEIAYQEEKIAEELRRTAERNEWLAALRESVPMPAR